MRNTCSNAVSNIGVGALGGIPNACRSWGPKGKEGQHVGGYRTFRTAVQEEKIRVWRGTG